MGARQRWPVIPHPAFDLRIRYLNGRPSGASYQRKLNLAEGTVTVAPTAAGGREEVFTSRADNVTVIRLTAAKGRKLNVSLALEKRFAFDSDPAHGLIHVALQAARLGELGMIRTNLDRFCRRHYLYNSLITSHAPNHTVYNLDAVLSLPRLFMEMLVYTEPGYVELLPAWPAEYPEGKLSGVRLYGGHTLTLSWRQGRLVSARLQAHRNDTLRIAYDGQTREMRLVKDETYTLKF